MTKYFKTSKMPRLGYLFLAFLVLFSSTIPAIHVRAAGADPFVTKSYEELPSQAMTGIAYGNGTYIAVGYYGAIIKSNNGKDWVNVKTKSDINYTGVTNPNSFTFNSVAYGKGLFVVTGSEGVILTSPDGQNWTQRVSGTSNGLWSTKFYTFNGVESFYVASTGKYLTSTDGINWSSVVPPGINPIYSVTQITVGNNGTRLGVGDGQGKIYSTTDGTNWTTRQPLNPDGSPSIGTNMLTWMNDRYFISDPSAYLWTSTDLVNFTSVGAPFKQTAMQTGNQMFNGFYDGTRYYLFGYQSPYGYGAVYTSTDAVNWQLQPFKKEFVAQMSSYLNGQYFRLGNEGLIMSENGSDWSYQWGGLFNDVVYDGTKYVAAGKLGSEGTIWTSTNLSSWGEETISDRIKGMNAIAIGNGKYVAVGEWNGSAGSTSIVTSNDGFTWTRQTGLTDSSNLIDVAYGNGTFVAVGYGSSNPTLKTSTDGVSWSTPNTMPTNVKSFSSVTYTNGRFIALGNEYDNYGNISETALTVSLDGALWNAYEGSYPSTSDELKNIIFDGTNYILVALDSNYETVIRTSTDLINWSNPIKPGGSLPYTSALLGQKGSTVYLFATDNSNNSIVYSSNDHGASWQNAGVDFADQTPASLISVANEVIITGNQQLVKSTATVAPQNSQLSQTTANFDKNVPAQADVTVSLTLNGNTLSNISNGATQLQAGTDYVVTGGNTVTIKKEYLALQGTGVTNLDFVFSGGQPQTLAVTVSDSTPQNSGLSQSTANFDKNVSNQADVTISLTLNGNTLASISNGATQLQAGTDYVVTGGNTVTIKKEYLALQGTGVTSLDFVFSGGQPQTLAVTVSDSTPQNSGLSQTTANFDKNVSNQADLTISLTLNGNTLSSISNGATQLQAGTDYVVTGGNTVTIKKEYLALQGTGVTSLDFVFSGGQPQTLAVTVSDSTPQNSGLSQTTANFDKNVPAQAGVTVSLTLNGNTLSSISNGATQLQAGTDYVVTGGNTVTIKKEYLALQGTGVTNLDFVFSGGQPQTLAVTVSDSTPQNSGLSQTTANFDKNVPAQADVTVSLTLNGNTLSSISNGATQLQAGTDYVVTGGNTVTIKKEYLALQGTGVTNLDFVFSGGQPQTLAVTVSDSTPQNSQLSQTSASFDKNVSAQADVTISLTLNGNVLNSINQGLTPLQAGIDYTVTGGDTVTIKKEYLAQLGTGISNFDFVFSAGQIQTLFVNVTDSTQSIGIPALLIPPTSGNGQVSLLWSPINDAIGYKVFVRTDAQPFDTELTTLASDVNTYDVTNLVNGTTYYFAVKVVYSGGDSSFSNEQSATPGTVPGTPTNVSAVAGDKQAVVSFIAPLDNGGAAITGYQIKDLNGNIVATGTTSPITVPNLENGTSYSFVVHALNQHGGSVASDQSIAVTPRASSNEGPTNPTNPEGGTPTPSTPVPSTPSTPSTGTTAPTTPVNNSNGVDILVNGVVERIGTATTTTVNNRSTTVITVNQKLLEEKLAEQGVGAIITIPLASQSDVVIGELNGQIVQQMEDKQAIIELKTDKATYKLPAQQIRVAQLKEQFGSNVDLNNLKIQLETSSATTEQSALVKQAASRGGFSEVSSPLNFEVHAQYGEQNVNITKFNSYVERTIAIPDGVDPNKITTGVVIEADGTVRHVPTKVTVDAGKYFAKVNSLTNSIYSIVWNPIEFKDVANHWAKSEVNNMGSRMVIQGVGEGLFNPNQDITRAEFTAIVVRGLGLKIEQGMVSFTDVKSSDWYESVIQTAYANGLIAGFEDGSFRPNDKITREQAMTIIAKAMEITGLSKKLTTENASTPLNSYSDVSQVAAWATKGVTNTLQAGIVTGRSDVQLAPKAHTTRAEVAAMIQRLLKQSDLI